MKKEALKYMKTNVELSLHQQLCRVRDLYVQTYKRPISLSTIILLMAEKNKTIFRLYDQVAAEELQEDASGNIYVEAADILVEPSSDDDFLTVRKLSNFISSHKFNSDEEAVLSKTGLLKYKDHFKRVRSAEWRALSDAIEERFRVKRENKKLNGITFKGFKGLKLKGEIEAWKLFL